MTRMTLRRKEAIVRDLQCGASRADIESKHNIETTDEELAEWRRLYETQGGREGMTLRGIKRSRRRREGETRGRHRHVAE